MSEVKKKGRTMTPELLEKLAKAREKGLEVIRAKREAKEMVKKAIMEQTYKEMNKKNQKQSDDNSTEEEDNESQESIKARYEEPKIKRRHSKPVDIPQPVAIQPAKYNNVKKVVKKKIVYMNESESESETSEDEIVYKPRKDKIKKNQREEEEEPRQVNRTSQYLSLF